MYFIFPSSGRVDTTIWMHYMVANETYGEKDLQQLVKNAASNTEQVLSATPYKTTAVCPPTTHRENYPS